MFVQRHVIATEDGSICNFQKSFHFPTRRSWPRSFLGNYEAPVALADSGGILRFLSMSYCARVGEYFGSQFVGLTRTTRRGEKEQNKSVCKRNGKFVEEIILSFTGTGSRGAAAGITVEQVFPRQVKVFRTKRRRRRSA